MTRITDILSQLLFKTAVEDGYDDNHYETTSYEFESLFPTTEIKDLILDYVENAQNQRLPKCQ